LQIDSARTAIKTRGLWSVKSFGTSALSTVDTTPLTYVLGPSMAMHRLMQLLRHRITEC